ncbi:phytase [Cystobasidium minutum MCA 4210]|uniref:phytase n=1 Tax=Cystobasidium minutum MCA 4210 TaxID=1397322 RepID=UPI0034CE5997|eukprot:jgi/Rhomi1/169609/fgenesh1_kg.3_\
MLFHSLLLSLFQALTISSQVVANPNYGDTLQAHQIPFIRPQIAPSHSTCQSSSNLPPHIFNHLAQYSPWFPAGRYPEPPSGCTIDQVNIIHRHASRYPTAGAGRIISSTLKRLQDAICNKGNSSSLFWMLDYHYKLGADDLVPLGVEEAKASAKCIRKRYARLAEEKGVFVRTSSCHRVVHTAKWWTDEFEQVSSKKLHIPPPLVISDAVTSNDSLANNGCPLHAALHTHWQWASVFTNPIAARLQREVVGHTVTAHDVIVLISLCAFQSVADNSLSKFCALFSKQEFEEYEYFNDLEKYYNTGKGNPLGPVLGIGYINELLARLTDRQVEDCTQTNSTLDDNPDTFPYGKGVYADFSHDNTMAAIVSAMGIFEANEEDLPLDHISPDREWKFGHIAPFAGRIAVERLKCGHDENKRYIRIVANDALITKLPCQSDENRLCRLDDFVRSQKFARVDGQDKWKECFREEAVEN